MISQADEVVWPEIFETMAEHFAEKDPVLMEKVQMIIE